MAHEGEQLAVGVELFAVLAVGLEIRFQQQASSSPFFALRMFEFLLAMLFGNAIGNERSTAKERIATMPGVKLHAFTMVSSAPPTGRSNLRVPITRECCQDLLRRRPLPDELGMTELVEKGSPFQRASSVGRGSGVGRALGVGLTLGVGVALGVPVGVGVAVGVAVGEGVTVGVAVGVNVAVAVAVGVGVGVGVVQPVSVYCWLSLVGMPPPDLPATA